MPFAGQAKRKWLERGKYPDAANRVNSNEMLHEQKCLLLSCSYLRGKASGRAGTGIADGRGSTEKQYISIPGLNTPFWPIPGSLAARRFKWWRLTSCLSKSSRLQETPAYHRFSLNPCRHRRWSISASSFGRAIGSAPER